MLPLQKNKLGGLATEIYQELSKYFSVDYDETSRTILTVTGAPYAGEGPSPAGAAGETAAASLSSQGMNLEHPELAPRE